MVIVHDGEIELPETKLRRQTSYLAALHDTSVGLLSRLDLDDLLHDIVSRACNLLGTPQGYLSLVSLVEPGEQDLRASVRVGIPPDHSYRPYRRGEGVAGTIWQTGKPLVINGYHEWPGRLRGGERERARAVVGVPLITDGQVIGVLSCVHTEMDRCFNDEDVTLLARFGELAAIALDHARIHRALREELAARTAAEQQLRAQYQGNPTATFTWRRAGDDWQLIDYNEAADLMTAGTIASYRGGLARTIYADTPEFAEYLARCDREQRILRVETPWIFSGRNERRDLVISYIPVAPDLVVMNTQDVTERKRSERRDAAFDALGQRLSATTTARDAARVIATIADDLLGWDACALYLYAAEDDMLRAVLSIDEVDGQRTEVAATGDARHPGPVIVRALTEGAQLILRDGPPVPITGLVPFGDTERMSASLMFVPIRRGPDTVGLLTIQSYTPGAYTEDDLATLQVLADYCGGALERVRAEESLKAAEHRYRSFVENIPAVVYLADATRNALLYTSPQREALLGYTAEEWVSEPRFWEKVIHPDDIERVRALDARTIGTGERATAEYRYIAKDGRTVWVRDDAVLVRDDAGEPLYWQGVVVDITERKQTEEALRESEERYRGLVELSPDAIMVHRNGRCAFINDAGATLLGVASADELIGLPFLDYVHPDDRAIASARIQRAHDAKAPLGALELRAVRRDGRVIDMEVISAPVTYHGEPATLAIMRDVTGRKRAEDELRHSATHDPLTDLPNRTLLMERLSHAIERQARDPARRFALLFIDLDRFKHANDSLGHLWGDRILAAFAGRLRLSLPSGATIARLAGDEFAVLLEEIAAVADAVRSADRIREVLESPFVTADNDVFISASIGIALGDHGARPEDVLRNADTAMYRAKALGKACAVVFDAAMRTDGGTFLQRESELRRAIARKELEAFYQPIIALETDRAIGFEALVRWRHPRLGIMGPTEFVPLAEETGLIVGIDRWMLREACAQLMRWDAQFPDDAGLGIGVNVSSAHLAQSNFVLWVERILRETGIDPARLRLEITESTLIAHTEIAAAALGQLRALGVRIVLDDFGVGYSSLDYLRRFPIDSVKIDRSFISHEEGDVMGAAIVRGIVALVHSLGMKVVAEGIEHSGQLTRLHDAHCDFGQGHLFSPPLSTDETARYIGRST